MEVNATWEKKYADLARSRDNGRSVDAGAQMQVR